MDNSQTGHSGDYLGAPIFVIGAPRSGTTYVVELLNRHSQIFITNELRVMTFLNRVLNRTSKDRWILMNGRNEFLKSLETDLPAVLERHYRRLGASPGMRWGDKNPHYADRKTDPECLDLIDRMFPEAQFINMVRDGRDVVTSLVKKGWADFDEAVDVWRRHVEHAEDFGSRVGADRFLMVRYEDLVEDDVAVASRMTDFLRLANDPVMLDFAATQAHDRTGFSGPMSDLGHLGEDPPKSTLPSKGEGDVVGATGDLLEKYGYL